MKRRRSLRLVLELGPADGLEVKVLFPLGVTMDAPEEITVTLAQSGRKLTYEMTGWRGQPGGCDRAIYHPESEP